MILRIDQIGTYETELAGLGSYMPVPGPLRFVCSWGSVRSALDADEGMNHRIHLERLRELAEKATPGPWQWFYSHPMYGTSGADMVWGPKGPGYGTIAETSPNDMWIEQQILDAQYIAACDPQTILALCDALDDERAKVAMLREILSTHSGICFESCEHDDCAAARAALAATEPQKE